MGKLDLEQNAVSNMRTLNNFTLTFEHWNVENLHYVEEFIGSNGGKNNCRM